MHNGPSMNEEAAHDVLAPNANPNQIRIYSGFEFSAITRSHTTSRIHHCWTTYRIRHTDEPPSAKLNNEGFT